MKVPIGSSIPGKATSTIAFQGNLDSLAGGPLAQTITTDQPFTVSGAAAQTSDTLNSLDGAVAYQTGDKDSHHG